ncbi:fimbrial protein [Pantoea dispersa]|uniref:fimbrial protein n=1 Tax=Pantoea dispersa TaxID=59814 RepID=UPI000736CDB5|nr:fimbrial protein [Pantoea dispersa]KTS32012.1 hypothetical protein NS389_18435 [Pantoea dispersa]KTS52743.1 hypothetical protein NS380_19085 [Pantoea dispersa]
MARYFIFTFLCLVLLSDALASSFSVNISGNVMVPADCKINNGMPISVNFGDVRTDKIDGKAYQQPVSFTLSCTNLPSNALKLQLQGNAASFDSGALRASVSGLGIAFFKSNAERLNINTSWVNFTYPALPVITAVPVKDKSSSLTGGSFTSAATLAVELQ